MATQVQLRRDTAANWTSSDPTLASGEVGVETDTSPQKFKIGDGSSTWSVLPYHGAIDDTASDTHAVWSASKITTELSSKMDDVVDDTTPQLGGDLDVNGNSIVSVSNGDIDITPNGTGNVSLGNLTFDADQTVGAGQDDYVLTYDNGTGLVSLEASAGGGGSSSYGRNYIDNSRFMVQQRKDWAPTETLSAPSTLTEVFLCDRWRVSALKSSVTLSFDGFSSGQTDVPYDPRSAPKFAVTTASTADSLVTLEQRIGEIRELSGKDIRIAFYAKADASKDIAVAFEQQYASGTPDVTGIDPQTFTLTTSWAKYEATVTLPSISGSTTNDRQDYLVMKFYFDAGSDYNTETNSLGTQSGDFNLSNIQLNIGTTTLDYDPLPLLEDHTRCELYYENSVGYQQRVGTAVGDILNIAQVTSGTAYVIIPFKTRKLATPDNITTYSSNTGTADRLYNDTTAADVTTEYWDATESHAVWRITSGVSTGDVLEGHWEVYSDF